MKKIVSIIFLLCNINYIFAQTETKETAKVVDNIIYYVDIPKRYHLKDKIIVKNNTNYYIGLVSIAICENEHFIALGSSMGLVPGKDYEVVSYRDNELKKLRSKKIAIKMKGFKPIIDNEESEFINIKPNEFQIRAFENRHDLVIEVFNSFFFER